MSGLTLLCLHGFTQNGAQLAAQLQPLRARFSNAVRVLCPDAPHSCSSASVAHLMTALRMTSAPPPPHLCWWNATDDGQLYRGADQSFAQLRALCEQTGRVGVLGFSQGAILASALAAMQERGAFPALSFVVLVAGSKPRAEALTPYFQTPLKLPSLHVWGERDLGATRAAPALVEAFAPATRQVVTWPGPHSVPTSGPAADAIVRWVNGDREGLSL